MKQRTEMTINTILVVFLIAGFAISAAWKVVELVCAIQEKGATP